MNNTVTTSNYYYSPQNPIYGKNIKVNIDNVWNPVDSYIYGPTQNSIFNQPNNKFGGGAMASQKFEKFSNGIAGGGGGGGDGVKDTYNYVTSNVKDVKTTSGAGNRRDGGGSGYRDGMTTSTTTNSIDGASRGIGTSKPSKHSTSRKLIAEHYDNETPRLCDHSLLANSANRMRPCSPLESYVSTSKDMVSFVAVDVINCTLLLEPQTMSSKTTLSFSFSQHCTMPKFRRKFFLFFCICDPKC